MTRQPCIETHLCVFPGCERDFDDIVACMNSEPGASRPCTLTPALIAVGLRRGRELRAAAFRRIFARLRPRF